MKIKIGFNKSNMICISTSHDLFTGSKEQAMLQALNEGKRVILTGTFSDELLDGLASFIKQRENDSNATGQLILIGQKPVGFMPVMSHEPKLEEKYQALTAQGFSTEDLEQLQQEKISLANSADLSKNSPEAHVEVETRNPIPNQNNRCISDILTIDLKKSFENQLTAINEKAKILLLNDYIKASNAAHNLYETIKKIYCETPAENVVQFKKDCKDAINAARPQLESHRGWKLILSYLMFTITGIGALIVLADVGHNCIKGKHFSFFQTDTAQKISALEQTLDKLDKTHEGLIA